MQGHYKLLINIEDWDGETKYAHYNYFMIGSPVAQYSLQVHSYSGTAGVIITKGCSRNLNLILFCMQTVSIFTF